MKLNTFILCNFTFAVTSCGIVAVGPEAIEYSLQNKSMQALVNDTADGTATMIAPSAYPSAGTASFSGHIAVYDNDVNLTELIFGNAEMVVDFAAATEQLSGNVTDLRLIDAEGTRVYGLPAPSILENYTGQLDVTGTLNSSGLPYTAEGEITDSSNEDFDLRIVGVAELYEYAGGDIVMISGASGFLTDSSAGVREFSTGRLAVVSD